MSMISKIFFLFSMYNGKKKLAYGDNPDDAYEILASRLRPHELQLVIKHDYIKIPQRDLQKYVNCLG